jgi:hypothetical protein
MRSTTTSVDGTGRGTVTLRPDRGVAARWTAVGLGAVALAVWVAIDAGDSVLAWAFAALCLVLTSWVVIQLAAPQRFELVLDDAAIDVRLPWQHLRVPWGHVHLARVVTVTGEPVLEVHVWDPDDPGQAAPRATGVLLPLGADQAVLHRVLEERLGLAPPR